MADEFAALQQRLQSLRSGATVAKIQRKALRAVGDLVKDAIVERAPVKTDSDRGELEPGELRDSIRARVSVPSDEAMLQGKRARVVIGPSGGGPKGNLVKLVAHDVEHGHFNAGKNGPKKGFTPAHPFIRPAEEATKDDAVALYRASVNADVKKAMGKNG